MIYAYPIKPAVLNSGCALESSRELLKECGSPPIPPNTMILLCW